MTHPHSNYSALIVDDSYLMRSRIERVLEQEPRITRIDQAEDGLKALEMVKKNEYALIMLDIEMPNMDGMEFLKRSKFHTDAKIIVLSTACEEGSEKANKAAFFGAFDVAPKPRGIFSQDDILHRVFLALKAHEDQPQTESEANQALT